MTTGADTDTVSSNRRLTENGDLVEIGGEFSVTRERDSVLFKERYENVLERSNRPVNLFMGDEVEATPPSDNDLVCTPFRAWILSGIFDDRFSRVDSNRSNAVGATEKYTMYKPTAKNIRLYDGENECPTPTEDLGIFAGNRVYPVAGPTIGDIYSEWRNYMVLLDPVVIEDDNGPLTQYRSSFAYTEYYYTDDGSADGSSANQRVPEFPITGGTGRFDSASGAVKNLGYTVITNEATGYYEQYEGL